MVTCSHGRYIFLSNSQGLTVKDWPCAGALCISRALPWSLGPPGVPGKSPVSSGPYLLPFHLYYILGIPCNISTKSLWLKRLQHSLLVSRAHSASEGAHDGVRSVLDTHTRPHTHHIPWVFEPRCPACTSAQGCGLGHC